MGLKSFEKLEFTDVVRTGEAWFCCCCCCFFYTAAWCVSVWRAIIPGIKICQTRANVVKRVGDEFLRPPLVTIACSRYDQFQHFSNEDVYAMADHIAHIHAIGTNSELEEEQTEYGVKCIEQGILFCNQARGVYRPIDHCIRDWMHNFTGSGVANVELAMIFHLCVNYGISLGTIQTFALGLTLPHKHGKVQKNWITTKRLHDDRLVSFSSVILCLVPIIQVFLDDVVKPLGIMIDQALCFTMLNDIIGLLSFGPDESMRHVSKLNQLLQLHGELFVSLYPGATIPKIPSCLSHTRKHDVRW